MSDLKNKLLTSLASLGYTERTKADDSQDPMDAVAHEYVVTSIMRPYIQKRYERAKEKVIAMLSKAGIDKLNEAKKSVARTASASTVVIADAQHHTVTAQVNPGASYLDEDSLKLDIIKQWNVLPGDVEELFLKHRKRYNPTVTYLVSEK